MQKCIISILVILFLSSCAKEESSIAMTEQQDQQLTSFMKEFEDKSKTESPELRSKLLDFYEVATVNACNPGDFGIITPDEVAAYARSIGHFDLRSFHDWTVDYGVAIRDILVKNKDWDEDALIRKLTTDKYDELYTTGSACEREMFAVFHKRAYVLGNTFGVYITGANATGFRVVADSQLLTFDGAFNTFVRMQDVQEGCNPDVN